MATRKSKIKRETKETSVDVSLNIDGSGKTSVSTGISFLDHLITSFGTHAMMDLTVKAKSKDKIEHHLIEDVAITIGSSIDKALGISAGTFLFISIGDLLPTVYEEHEKGYKNLASLCLGTFVMILSHALV